MAEDASQAQQDRPAGRRKGMLMGLIILAVMLVEGGGIFVAMKLFGSRPAPAIGAGLIEPQAEQLPDQEVLIARLKAPNTKTGKLFLYDIEVHALVEHGKVAGLQELLERRQATVQDRLAKIIRAADPQYLQEPGLETLRRQFKYELEQIAGQEGVIREILVPKCTPFRADY